MDEFVIVRNPDGDSSLPYLVRLPLPSGPVVLKVRDTWPRTAKVYCHPSEDWPDGAIDSLEVVERVPVRTCLRRGAAVDLVLDRGRENRSQFVFARARGRDVIFWQSARTARQARPAVSVPTRRASGRVLEILVDSHERYPWRFSAQQASTTRRALTAGDYAVEHDGSVVAAVERKSLPDLAGTLTSGRLRYLLAALDGLPRAALVVEDRYSAVFKTGFVTPGVMAEGLAEAQVCFPGVPIVFCETRPLAQEWTYRFLGAALEHHLEALAGAARVEGLPMGVGIPAVAAPAVGRTVTPRAVLPGAPSAAEVREWAREQGIEVADKGRIAASVLDAYRAAHPD